MEKIERTDRTRFGGGAVVGRTARFDAEAQEKFLEELRRRGNVTDAARAAGFGRSVAYEHRKADSEFAAA